MGPVLIRPLTKLWVPAVWRLAVRERSPLLTLWAREAKQNTKRKCQCRKAMLHRSLPLQRKMRNVCPGGSAIFWGMAVAVGGETRAGVSPEDCGTAHAIHRPAVADGAVHRIGSFG